MAAGGRGRAPSPIQMNQAGTSSDQAADQEVLTLSQCLEAALSKSDSAAILEKNLGISQAQYKQTVAKNTLSLNAGLGGGATGGFGNTTLLSQQRHDYRDLRRLYDRHPP